MSELTVKVAYAEGADRSFGLPSRATGGAAGMDLRANLAPGERTDGVTLQPGEFRLIPSGVRVAVPDGFEAQIRPRSGIAGRHGVTVLNSPGTVDPDYRGEIGVILINSGRELFHVAHGDRIAQIVFSQVVRCSLRLEDDLGDTKRGGRGFGSTGRE